MRIKIQKIREASDNRPEGYFEDVVSSGEISECGLWLSLTNDEYVRLFNKYNNAKILQQDEALSADKKHKMAALPLYKKISNALGASANWAISGFPLTQTDVLKSRLSICQTCEFWNAAGFGGTGSCKKCGCSTQAKLRMASEKCPIGKW